MKYKLFLLKNNRKMEENIELERDVFPKHYSNKNMLRDEYAIFTQFNFREITKAHGFKIHVATTLKDYQEILDTVYSYCEENNITFKYISNKLYLEHNLSSQEDRKLSGKFITIYPNSDEEFKTILNDLDERLNKYDVPYIMTDKRYKDSILFYRYGSFSVDDVMTFPNGVIYFDERKIGYSLPDCVEEPFPDQKQEVPKVIDTKYQITRALKYKNSGGIYKGIYIEEKMPVVLKEARPGIYDAGVSAIENKKNEAGFLKKISSTKLVKYFPKYVDDFVDCGHYFVVESLEKGMKLEDFKVSEVVENEKALEKVIENILTFAVEVHDFGYFIGDISSTNILIGEDYNIKWIDTEHFSSLNDKKDVYFKTSGFYNYKINSLSNEEQDKQQLGYLIMNIFTNSNLFLNIDKSGKSSLSFFYKSVKNNKYKSLVYNLVHNNETTLEKILQQFKQNTLPNQINIEEKNYSVKNLEETFNKYVSNNTYYYSNPDDIEKSKSLYGKEGIGLVFEKKVVSFDEVLTHSHKDYSEALENEDCSLESGLANSLLTLPKNKSPYKIIKNELLKVLMSDELNDLGLLRGELGIIYALIDDLSLVEILKDKLDDLIEEYLTNNYSFPIRRGSKIYAPYIKFGSAGLVKVLIKYDKTYAENYYKNVIVGIGKKLAQENYTQNATYATGMSGIIDVLLDIYDYTKDEFYLDAAEEKVQQLNDYILEYEGDYFISSQSFSSLGLDYLGGSAGVLAVYYRYLQLKEEYYDN